jgi:hypothetical protein
MIVTGLVIAAPWIDKILAGEKTWEIRSPAAIPLAKDEVSAAKEDKPKKTKKDKEDAPSRPAEPTPTPAPADKSGDDVQAPSSPQG